MRAFKLVLIFSIGTLTTAVACGQVHSYHHRSTIQGDMAAGLGEMAAGFGIYAECEARAAEHWARVEAEQYRIESARRQAALARQQQRRDEVRARAVRRQQRAKEAATAPHVTEVMNVHTGRFVWNDALRSPRLAVAGNEAEKLARQWAQFGEFTAADRHRLQTLVMQLRAVYEQEASRTTHPVRVVRMRAIKLLERIAVG